jgi:hypothetical protein
MNALSAWDLLQIWEQGRAQLPAERGLTLLAAACPDMPVDVLAELTIGQRDARLLALRERTFGPQLASLVICPDCGERLELAVGVTDLLVGDGTARVVVSGSEGREDEGATLSLVTASYEVLFRLPNSRDLLAVARCQDPDAARQLLLERCLLRVRQNGDDAEPAQLPAEVAAATIECMAQADPQADVQLDLSCPACDHRWQTAFDIVSFFWTEIDTWAQRTLRQVHTLASAYGWREADILAMSPWRRQLYLEMVGR